MVRDNLRQRFVSTLESLGGSAGNTKLQAELGWRDDTYWNTHAALVEDNTITKGRGRGGSVSLTASADNAAQPSAVAPPVHTPQAQKATPTPLPTRNSGRNGGSMFEQTFKNISTTSCGKRPAARPSWTIPSRHRGYCSSNTSTTWNRAGPWKPTLSASPTPASSTLPTVGRNGRPQEGRLFVRP
jgi:hypothetical protein